MIVALARVLRRWAHRLPPYVRLAVVRLARRAPWPAALRARLREIARAASYTRPGAPRPGTYAVAPDEVAFAAWAARQPPPEATAASAAARLAALRRRPRISILMPVREPDPLMLDQALRSVVAQLYPDWELCAGDASRDPRVRATLEALAAAHPGRVRLVRLPEGHAAGPTQAALKLARGEFVAFLNHEDVLEPDALLEAAAALDEDPVPDVVYTDHDVLGTDGLRRHPQFKPDWCPELLLSYMYFGHLKVYRTSLVREAGGLPAGEGGAADYDLALRLVERTHRVGHVPRILYHRRAAAPSTPGPDPADRFEGGRKTLELALQRRGIPARAEWPDFARRLGIGAFRVRFDPAPGVPVTIVIPTRDRVELLQSCVASVEEKTAHRAFEIVILDNDSREPETLDYLRRSPHRVVACPGPFNFAALANRGAREARTEHFVLLNNDTSVIEKDWLGELLGWGRLPGVGAVGAKLLYPDGRIQHAGVVLGIQGLAGHAFQPRLDDETNVEYQAYAHVVRNYLAVSAACMLTTQTAFAAVGGFNERDLKVGWNDVDYCLRLRERGYRVIFTPWAKLTHLESQSRGDDKDPSEVRYMLRRWKSYVERDPMYSPNLSRKDGLFMPRGDAGEEQSFFYRDDAGDWQESRS